MSYHLAKTRTMTLVMTPLKALSKQSNTVNNAPIESFFHILKANSVHHKQYESFHDFKVVVDDFINYYNNHRIKQKGNGLSPVQYRQLTTEFVG
ncbi:IS3 family transposase [Leuconostoc rapi]|uniref:IS3 family transposase n=1 Tax=Leuconostoc rapi TaxID=1406906 RepID=UPI0039EC1B6C